MAASHAIRVTTRAPSKVEPLPSFASVDIGPQIASVTTDPGGARRPAADVFCRDAGRGDCSDAKAVAGSRYARAVAAV
jgi:hypothetical protein